QLQGEGGHRVFSSREADLHCRSEQTHAFARAAELACEVACAVKPRCAALWLGGQLCGSLEGGDRNVSGPAKRCPVRSSFERLCDRLVRPGRRRGPVPDGAIGLLGERLGKGSVRVPKLLGCRRLLDRRDDQGMPKSKSSRI